MEFDKTRHNKDGKHPRDPEGWVDYAFLFGWRPNRAAKNREMVANKEHIQGYLEIETWLANSWNRPIPAQYVGDLPQAGGSGARPYYFELDEGYHIEEVEDEEILT